MWQNDAKTTILLRNICKIGTNVTKMIRKLQFYLETCAKMIQRDITGTQRDIRGTQMLQKTTILLKNRRKMLQRDTQGTQRDKRGTQNVKKCLEIPVISSFLFFSMCHLLIESHETWTYASFMTQLGLDVTISRQLAQIIPEV